MPSEQPPIDISRAAIAVPLAEWQRMNQRIGFLEGVWIGIKTELAKDVVANVDKRYAEICGEAP